MRPDKNTYYMDMACVVSERSTCLRKRWGAVIVKNDEVVATGYNGSPRGVYSCMDLGECYRTKHNIPRGTRYETCQAVHAEMNAIISASRKELIDSTMYVYGFDCETNKPVENPSSCFMCRRLIINAGIKEVIFLQGYDTEGNMIFASDHTSDWVRADSMALLANTEVESAY